MAASGRCLIWRRLPSSVSRPICEHPQSWTWVGGTSRAALVGLLMGVGSLSIATIGARGKVGTSPWEQGVGAMCSQTVLATDWSPVPDWMEVVHEVERGLRAMQLSLLLFAPHWPLLFVLPHQYRLALPPLLGCPLLLAALPQVKPQGSHSRDVLTIVLPRGEGAPPSSRLHGLISRARPLVLL